jgi:transcriptional regulator with XRE-family HTH domain
MKEALLWAGLSQERLGVLAGIDEMSSSAFMNQYERGKHEPDFSLVEQVAQVLDVPEATSTARTAMWPHCSFICTARQRLSDKRPLD